MRHEIRMLFVWLAIRTLVFAALAGFGALDWEVAAWAILICSILDATGTLRDYHARDRMRP